MSYNLLLRLEGYSQNPIKRSLENFTTEVMAYLINEDRMFRREFVRHVIPDGRLARVFAHATAETQKRYFGTGIVDLVLLNRRKQRQLLVEVKIASGETWTKLPGGGWFPQVRKYLSYRQGPVVYLSTKPVPTPEVRSKRFLGHVYLEDLYAKLNDKRDVLTEIGGMFLELMEENNMAHVRPFNKTDLRDAQRAFDFAAKCEGILQEMMVQIQRDFRKIFHSRTTFTSAHFSPASECAYSWSKFRGGNVAYVTIWIGPSDSKLDFGVQIRVRSAKENLKKLNRRLDWEEWRSWLTTSHPVRCDRSDMSIYKMTGIVLKDLRKLRTVLK